jgi:uncharacterized protein YbjT (DUF2867 family)
MSHQIRKGHGKRIAVAGATGRIGSALISGLVDDDVDLVALSRGTSREFNIGGVSAAVVDFEKPHTLSNALEGADKLFIAHGTSARQVENEIALIDAAVASGVSHIVKVSVMGPPLRLHPWDWHQEIEAHLATRNIGYTLLRPTTFVDTLARASAPVAQGSWGGAAGHGRVNLIDTRDVADVARVALLDNDDVNAQRAHHLSGPAAVTMYEVATELSTQLGREVVYQHRHPTEQRELLIGSGLTEMVADLLLGIERLIEQSAQAETTATVAELTGKPPRPFSTWIKENIATFQRPLRNDR